ncbi:FAD-dependent oxidoreductase [Aquihabitans daechungensis]|uniref:FAD-dependent oxidoreductase n=1 Tax=Aquihabitans daechungensis TaxID=1052257 RepID=UPI003BA2B25D
MADRLVVIGGDAAGMAAATNARRGRPDLEIVVLEKGTHTSYSACGIPYVVSGAVPSLDELIVRTPQEFRDQFRIDVRTRHEARSIDLDARRIEVRALDQDRTLHLGFDLLHLATGARPVRPDLPGIDGPDIYGVQTIDDAQVLLDAMGSKNRRTVTVVGAGYIGLEMAEAFVRRGARVTLVDSGAQPMGSLDPDMGAKVAAAVRRFGIDLRLGTQVDGFDPGTVHTTNGDIPADLVILGLGVTPNSAIGVDAGLDAGAAGAIAVDHRQRASREGIYAAGDCADARHQVSGDRVHVALGTVANKTGRVAGINLGGGYASFPGVLGTAVTRVCDVEIARTGLSQDQADAAGIECLVGTVEATTRAGYYPGAEAVHARVLVEKGSGRLVGGQLVGADRAGKRIDTVATAITAGMTASEFVELDLAYAPAVSPIWDAFQLAARSTLT